MARNCKFTLADWRFGLWRYVAVYHKSSHFQFSNIFRNHASAFQLFVLWFYSPLRFPPLSLTTCVKTPQNQNLTDCAGQQYNWLYTMCCEMQWTKQIEKQVAYFLNLFHLPWVLLGTALGRHFLTTVCIWSRCSSIKNEISDRELWEALEGLNKLSVTYLCLSPEFSL